jgi:hypothetical protein
MIKSVAETYHATPIVLPHPEIDALIPTPEARVMVAENLDYLAGRLELDPEETDVSFAVGRALRRFAKEVHPRGQTTRI